MSPPSLSVKEEQVSPPANYISQNALGLQERNYLGLPDCSSVDSSSLSSLSTHENRNLNLKATELRLGLPGSLSPERESNICLLSPRTFDEKFLFPLLPSKEVNGLSSNKNLVSGNKRGFSDTINEFLKVKDSPYADKNWMLNGGTQANTKKDVPKSIQENRSNAKIENCQAAPASVGDSNNNSNAPASKAQVVGWPPIRSYRKNTLATTSKNNEDAEEKPGQGPLFVKVSMDGAPYLRKIDLRTYTSYPELSSALEKMFSCFTLGQYRPRGTSGREMLNEIKLKDLLHGSENVLTYEDKDGDWMLVGDVPWDMFIDSCRKLKIMKSSDAIGLAPRSVEKSKNKV